MQMVVVLLLLLLRGNSWALGICVGHDTGGFLLGERAGVCLHPTSPLVISQVLVVLPPCHLAQTAAYLSPACTRGEVLPSSLTEERQLIIHQQRILLVSVSLATSGSGQQK